MVPDGIAVSWSPNEAALDPLEYAVELLRDKQHVLAVSILQGLLAENPDDAGALFNLGMAESDLGKLDDATTHLKALLELDPSHAHGWVALGVAHQRAGATDKAIEALREGVRLAPEDPHARKNLGGLLAKKGVLDEAELHLRAAVRHLPTDQQVLYGLAYVLVKRGGDEQISEADALFQVAISIAPDSDIAELCRIERGKIAQSGFRAAAGGHLRMDAVMYCLGALKTFAPLSKEEVRKITFEIAMLGTKGLDVNDPAEKYQLRSLPGKFSGLHLVSIEYVGFKIVDPSVDLGFDLSEEYNEAQRLSGLTEKQDGSTSTI